MTQEGKTESRMSALDDIKVKEGVEKAGDMIDEKTDGKYADQVDMAQDKVEELIDEQAEEADED